MPTNSTRRKRKPADRPKKPYADFPMYAHALGYWSAKVNGRIVRSVAGGESLRVS